MKTTLTKTVTVEVDGEKHQVEIDAQIQFDLYTSIWHESRPGIGQPETMSETKVQDVECLDVEICQSSLGPLPIGLAAKLSEAVKSGWKSLITESDMMEAAEATI